MYLNMGLITYANSEGDRLKGAEILGDEILPFPI